MCLHISLKQDAATFFKSISGSCTHKTNNGTAPASTTFCAKSIHYLFSLPAPCPAINPNAHAADSFTLGSNSSRHITKGSKALHSTTAVANA